MTDTDDGLVSQRARTVIAGVVLGLWGLSVVASVMSALLLNRSLPVDPWVSAIALGTSGAVFGSSFWRSTDRR